MTEKIDHKIIMLYSKMIRSDKENITFFLKSNLDIYIKIKILNFMKWKTVKTLCWLNPDIRKIVANVKYWTFNFSRLIGKDKLPNKRLTSKNIYDSFRMLARCKYDGLYPCRQYFTSFTHPSILSPNKDIYCKAHLSPYCQYTYIRGQKKGTRCQDLVYKVVRPKSTYKGHHEYCGNHLKTKSVQKLLENE